MSSGRPACIVIRVYFAFISTLMIIDMVIVIWSLQNGLNRTTKTPIPARLLLHIRRGCPKGAAARGRKASWEEANRPNAAGVLLPRGAFIVQVLIGISSPDCSNIIPQQVLRSTTPSSMEKGVGDSGPPLGVRSQCSRLRRGRRREVGPRLDECSRVCGQHNSSASPPRLPHPRPSTDERPL